MLYLAKRHASSIIFVLFFLLLFLTNFTPNTFLSGWDSLQTELNPDLAIKRSLFSSWQEYQSLGLAAGMGHAADLVRALLMWPVAHILPLWAVRYTFTMSMVLVGGLGMMQLLRLVGFPKHKEAFVLLGGMSYVLNFNIIQMMYLPFEAFSVYVAMLPWQVWIFLRILTKQTTRKDWLLFALVTILSTPQSVAQQTFVVVLLLFGLLTLGVFLQQRARHVIRQAFLALLLVLSINSFWILPQAYFLTTNGAVVRTAKINQLATEDVFYSNKDKGNIVDFVKDNGFFYDRLDMFSNPLFLPWKEYRESVPGVLAISLLALVMIGGMFVPSKFRLPFLIVLGLLLVTLLSNTPPFTFLNDLIRKNTLINQIFRSPFTKFGIPHALVSTYFFVIGAAAMTELGQKYIKHKGVFPLVFGILLVTLLGLNSPAFAGNYIAKEMKVQLPQEYFALMQYFQKQDKNQRIALLPEYTHWGWFYHSWPNGSNYDGSGFLWYGIEQPILSRTFDVWSSESEGYFWEAQRALESEDIVSFERVLDKYDVDYVLLDKSVIPVIATVKAIQYDRIQTMLSQSTTIHLEKQFGFLSLYKVTHKVPSNTFVKAFSSLPNVGPDIVFTNDDTAYAEVGPYQTNTKKPFDRYYPFLDITSQTNLSSPAWTIQETPTTWQFHAPIPKGMAHLQTADTIELNIYQSGTAVKYLMPYTIVSNDQTIIATFPKTLVDAFPLQKAPVDHCLNSTRGSITKQLDSQGLTITTNNGAIGCVSFSDEFLDQSYGYVVRVDTKNVMGRRLYFYILDLTKDQPYLEDRLTKDTAYYVVGAKYNQGYGYSFSFQSDSFSTISSQNILQNLSVYLIPYQLLKEVSLPQNPVATPSALPQQSVTKDAYYWYRMQVPQQNAIVVLSQSYQPGWHMYRVDPQNLLQIHMPFFFGKEVTTHIPINNWANGWVLDQSQDQRQKTNDQLVIVYLPQYLEYAGFVLLTLPFFWLGIRLLLRQFRRK